MYTRMRMRMRRMMMRRMRTMMRMRRRINTLSTLLGPFFYLFFNFNFHAIARQDEAFLLMPCHGNELNQTWGNLQALHNWRRGNGIGFEHGPLVYFLFSVPLKRGKKKRKIGLVKAVWWPC